MKYITSIIIAALFVQKLSAQNLIANPSFETPKITNDCPSTQAQFDKLANWSSRTQTVSGNAFHSPDWLKVGCYNQDVYGHLAVPNTGNGVAFVTSEELAQQNLSGALNEALYVFKAQVKIFSASTIYNFDPDHNYYFRLRLSYDEMEYESENNLNDGLTCVEDYRQLNGENMLTFLIPIQKTTQYLNNWQQIMLDNIKIFNFGYDWLGFDMVVFDEDGEERICEQIGIQVDDLELFKDCCGEYVLYQNASDAIPDNTQRREYIRAGENIGAPNMSIGPVTIETGRYVKFRAGEYIDLQPGFNQEPGSTFIAEIAPCGSESDVNLNFDVNFDYANQCAFLNCDESYYPPTSSNCFGTNAAFYSNGAGWYKIQVKLDNGQIVYEDINSITSLIQQYWNGAGSAYFTPLQSQALVTVIIFNCLNSEERIFTLSYEYLTGCTPTSKKEDEFVVQEINAADIFSIKVFPNPTTDLLSIVSDDMQKMHKNGWKFEILNNISCMVKTGVTSGSIDISQLTQGVYYLKLMTNEKRIVAFKIVKL